MTTLGDNNSLDKEKIDEDLEIYYPSQEELKKNFIKKFTKNLIFSKPSIMKFYTYKNI